MYKILEGRATVEATDGTGNPNVWALLMKECGLGDHIQSLPVIYDMVTKGIDPVIYCNPFVHPMYNRMCLDLHAEENICPNFSLFNARNFGRIYSLWQWGVDDDRFTKGESAINRTSLFASFFGLERPKQFDWIAALGATVDNELRDKEYIVFAPQSENKHRTYTREAETYYELKEYFTNIEWLGKPQGRLRKIVPTLQELIQLVYNAKAVLACDNGILHLAMALDVPTMGLFGATDENVVIEPYEYYLPKAHREILRTEGTGCKRPCNLIPTELGGTRGFGLNGKCISKPDCMQEFNPLSVAQSFYRFSKGEYKWQQPILGDCTMPILRALA